MEAKTKEIRRYITLEFNEKDLKELGDEISGIINFCNGSNYSNIREKINKMKKMSEFLYVLSTSLDEIHS